MPGEGLRPLADRARYPRLAPASRKHQPLEPQERPWEHIPDVFRVVVDISDALVLAAPHPIVLLSTADSGFSQEQVLGNHRMVQEGRVVGRCTVELQRQRVLNHALEERLRITNFNTFPVTLPPSYVFDADFADIFEVRGHRRGMVGSHSHPEVGERTLAFAYLGVDGLWRRTLITFDQRPEVLTAGSASFHLHLEPRQTMELSLRVLLDGRAPTRVDALRQLHREYAGWREAFVDIETDNGGVKQVGAG